MFLSGQGKFFRLKKQDKEEKRGRATNSPFFCSLVLISFFLLPNPSHNRAGCSDAKRQLRRSLKDFAQPFLDPGFQQPVVENLHRPLLERAGAADEPVAVGAFDLHIEQTRQSRVAGI